MGFFQKLKGIFARVAVEPVVALPVAVEEVAAVEDCVRDSGADEIRSSLVLLGYHQDVANLVVEGDLAKADDYLSIYRYEAARVFNCAVSFTEKTSVSRSDLLRVAAKYIADFSRIHEKFFVNTVGNLDVETSIELVGQGVLGVHCYSELLLLDLSQHIDCHPRMEDLLRAIIQHRLSLNFDGMLMLLAGKDRAEGGGLSGLHRLSKIMRNKGYDFSVCEPVEIWPFLWCAIHCEHFKAGVISDLLAWGLRIEDPNNYLSIKHMQTIRPKFMPVFKSIIDEMREGERRNAEREAANIAQALAEAGLTQDDTPKPRRRM
ncbi:hypothetical protein NJG17_08445 [Stenotrophomonas maltophilia]|jgi:hypothetical protein|uniref:hypothetical protein n=1 Tax=Stenotrophomonas maltophilia TaxID=40324 RepID=UPI001310F362|nr:hypothetical protein [Stenotrophomonas maltophilia]MBH1463620.1 hypothetical protein [Stenotrophomonas maltophilia]MBH1613804.1 hypothetical protein [Stenotrophomonas maltophilia]MBN5166259.1 hypothetical protein [Stenotrophomonas maltophilia]MCO7499925.1 hypothetical protein [Stenotrophomonas maltophilia]WNV16802.1 hypothetical protein RS400_09740 [Stenotrophomonas maltophilia]